MVAGPYTSQRWCIVVAWIKWLKTHIKLPPVWYYDECVQKYLKEIKVNTTTVVIVYWFVIYEYNIVFTFSILYYNIIM